METYDAYLITNEYEKDAIGQRIPKPQKRGIFCETKSIRRDEFYNAGEKGIKVARHILVTPKVNYEGESIIEYDGKPYTIYRTYEVPGSDDIELYLEDRSGLNVEKNTD